MITEHMCVVLADVFGVAMLNAFGAGEDRMVLLDATGGTNKYGYQFYSLVVVDDFREGVPVAFMLTSSQDAEQVQTFMQVMNDNCNMTGTPATDTASRLLPS